MPGTPKLQVFDRETPEQGKRYLFYCPACQENHCFDVGKKDHPVWTFNDNMDCPTFSPSLLYPDKTPRCHLHVEAGQIVYSADCGHAMAGQTVDMVDIPGHEHWG